MFFFRKEVGENLLTMLNREGLESMDNISREGLVVTVGLATEYLSPYVPLSTPSVLRPSLCLPGSRASTAYSTR